MTIFLMIASLAIFIGGTFIRVHDTNLVTGYENNDISFVLMAVAIFVPLLKLQYSYDTKFKDKLSDLDKNITNKLSDINTIAERQQKNYSSLLKEIREIDSITYVGTANDSANEVSEKLKYATEVYNTFIIYEPPYSQSVELNIFGSIYTCIKSGNVRWEETTSELGMKRIRKIYEKAGGTTLNSFLPRVIHSKFGNFPVCNFIILRYDSKNNHNTIHELTEEIYFGWGYDESAANKQVFKSSSKQLIDFFKGYHDSLRQDAISYPYKSKYAKSETKKLTEET